MERKQLKTDEYKDLLVLATPTQGEYSGVNIFLIIELLE